MRLLWSGVRDLSLPDPEPLGDVRREEGRGGGLAGDLRERGEAMPMAGAAAAAAV
jgi:hypothetical protein